MNLTLKHLWSLLSSERKEELKKEKGIVKSGYSEVQDNQIVHDGIEEGDLEGKITEKELKEELGLNVDNKKVSLKEVVEAKNNNKKNVKQNEKKNNDSSVKPSAKKTS